MTLTLTDEQKSFVDSIRDFCARETATREQRGDDPHNEAIYKKMAELGWLGVAIDEEYGGTGGGLTDMCLLLDETAYGMAPVAGIGTTFIVAGAYERFGSDEQKQEILGGIVNGATEAIAMSEPEAGSDVGALQCKIERRNGGYVINGQKTWISNAHHSDHILLIGRSERGSDKHQG
jgi:isovaleryl-CoA dehydrogenase